MGQDTRRLQAHGRMDLVDAFNKALELIENECTCEHCEHYCEEYIYLDESTPMNWCSFYNQRQELDDTCDNFSRG